MIREAFFEAFGLLKALPLLWIGGLAIGAVSVGDILLGEAGPAFSGSLQLLSLLLFPFIIAGSYGIIREKNGDITTFLRYATGYYFRVLLPLIIIVFAALVTIFLVMIPIAIMGGTPTADMIFFIALGVTIPIMLLTYFYDCFAVFSDEKIVDSIRSSITIVLYQAWKVLLFIVVNSVVLGTLLFGLAFVWMGLLWEKMSEIAAMDPEVISTMSGEEVMALLGPDALFATAVILFIWALIATPFTLAFKAAFFQRLGEMPVIEQQVGVYDEKGRWYKY